MPGKCHAGTIRKLYDRSSKGKKVKEHSLEKSLETSKKTWALNIPSNYIRFSRIV